MFEATAVWKTHTKDQFDPAGFVIMVEVEPISTNLMPDSMSKLFDHIKSGKCDGFEIDLGTSKKYIVKSQEAAE